MSGLDYPRFDGLALCAETDPEAFFPEKGGSSRDAKQLCRSCEVRTECLEWALDRDERFGIWGGLSERERRRLRARPAPVPAAPVPAAAPPRPVEPPVQAPPAPPAPAATTTRTGRRRWADAELADAVATLCGYGLTIGEMAAQLDVTPTRVRRVISQQRAA